MTLRLYRRNGLSLGAQGGGSGDLKSEGDKRHNAIEWVESQKYTDQEADSSMTTTYVAPACHERSKEDHERIHKLWAICEFPRDPFTSENGRQHRGLSANARQAGRVELHIVDM